MQLDVREHFREIVEPAIADYEQAEADLTRTAQTGDETALRRTSLRALRLGGSAALLLHHFADIVARRPAVGFPDFHERVDDVRDWMINNGARDLVLLGDVADALKHAVLTRRLPREVEEVGQVLTAGRGYGNGRYGEGKFGGVDEVWILARSGPRPLRSVLQSVRTAWEAVLFA